MLSFILDGALVNEPKGLTEVMHRIYYNEGINGYLEQFEGSVTFYGAEYKTLRERFFLDGCSVIPIEVQSNNDIYLGNIFLSDAEWHPSRCEVTCEIVDRSIISLIDNNKDIKAIFNVARSKNDVDIASSVVVQSDLLMIRVTTADANTAADRYGVRAYDALKFLIAFMSDGQIGFVSDYFNPETNFLMPTATRNPTIMTGYSVRLGAQLDPADNRWPYMSYEQVYSDLNSQYNITFSLEYIAGVPTIRVEPKAYFRAMTMLALLEQANDVMQEAERESYYQLMKFGSSKAETTDFFYYPSERLQSWRKEEYHLGGQCNTSAVLDLTLRYLVTDPNVIMRSLPIAVGGLDDDSNDDEHFLVLFDGNNETVITNHPVNPNEYYYNDQLSNLAVANRWGDGVPLPIFLFLGANEDEARAYNGSDIILSKCVYTSGTSTQSYYAFAELPIRTPPQGYDPNTNVVDGTIQETCVTPMPVTYYDVPFTGVYTVNARVTFSTTGLRIGIGNVIGCSIVRYSNLDVIYGGTDGAVQIGFANVNPNVNFLSFEGSATFAALSGDKLALRFDGVDTGFGPDPFDVILHNGSYMEIPGRGLITKTYDPSDNWLLKSSTPYPITDEWWRTFRNNWHQRILMTFNDGRVFGYVKDAKRSIHTGDAEISIVSKFSEATK